MHDGCRPLAETIDRIVPEDAEFVVFDLDRTVHLEVTIGERIGWEIMIDPELRDGAAAADKPFFQWRRPIRSLVRFERGARYWGLPGLLYAATVRLGDRSEAWHRLLVRRMGPGYVERVQGLLRGVLMASQADYTPDQLRIFAERAWRRWQSRLVVDRDVVRAVRRRCPRLKAVLLSSASTRPTVEHAAAELGADGYVSSAVDLYPSEKGEVFSAPVGLPGWLRHGRPRYFSRPGAVLHNASLNKVSLLRMQYPEVFVPGVVSVGISDNNYGEDKSWPEHFSHVVALNSRHPFSPFVTASSPCRSIASIDALPVGGVEAAHSTGWLGTLKARVADESVLAGMFGSEELGRLESMAEQLRLAREQVAALADGSLRQHVAELGARVAEAVDRYNAASARQKAAIVRELDRLGRRARRLRAELWRKNRPSWPIIERMEALHELAAQTLAA
ncbi:MAG: hypothetical protein D6760_07085, partial [Deltaproteobacteria bacterium]